MILVSGNIATGKSTLAALLSNKLGLAVIEEDVEGNEFINSFYEDMPRWGLHSQLHFIVSRAKSIDKHEDDDNVILDRSMSEDFHVFSKSLRYNEIIRTREYNLIKKTYERLQFLEKDVTHCIYLYDDADEISNRVRKRGHFYEKDLSLDYIQSLNRLYSQWRKKAPYKMLDIKTSEFDFRDQKMFQKILEFLKAN